MDGASGTLTVTRRFRVTWRGAWLSAACLVFSATGMALIIRAASTSDVLFGALAVLLFGGGGLLAASPLLSRRPVLVLDEGGVRAVAPWPRRRSHDRTMGWDDIARIRAVTQVVPHRGGTLLLHYLEFVSHDATGRHFAPPTPWETSFTVRAQATWDHTIDEIVAKAHRHRVNLVFEDHRLWHAPPM